MSWFLAWSAVVGQTAETAETVTKTEPDAYARLVSLLLLLLVAGAGGIILIVMLFNTWRRYNRRISEQRREKTRDTDLWQAGGDRLAQQIEQGLRAERGQTLGDTENDNEDEGTKRPPWEGDPDEHWDTGADYDGDPDPDDDTPRV